MGQSLSSRVEWSSMTTAQPDGSQANLIAKSLANEDLLHDLVRYVEHLVQQYPQEAKIEFKKPLQYFTSTLRPSSFANDKSFAVLAAVGKNGVAVNSTAARHDNLGHMFQLELTANNQYVAKVWNFEHLHKLLNVAGEHKLREAQDIVQANREPFTVITGASSPDASAALIEAVEQIKNETDAYKKDQQVRSLKLLSILNGFDLKMLATAAKTNDDASYVTLNSIEQELQMLKSFCGKKKDSPLVSIVYDSEFVFSNGCRSPPWRQIYGELCYLIVQTVEERLVVTASKKGFFVNKGYCTDAEGVEKLNYEKDPASDVYATLTLLLRAKSKHFAATIDKQEFAFNPAVKAKIAVPVTKSDKSIDKTPVVEEEKRHEIMETHSASVRKAEHRSAAPKQQPAVATNTEGAKKKKTAVKKYQQALGPSSKWRNINATSDEEYKKNIAAKAQSHYRESAEDRPEAIAKRRLQHCGADFDEEDGTEVEDIHSDSDDFKRQDANDVPAEFWQIQKLVKYLRIGNQTATIIAICAMRDIDLTNEANQLAMRDVGGLDILVNLLDTEDPRCVRGALRVLKEITRNVQIRSAISELDAIYPMVELLDDQNEDMKCLAADTLTNCAKNATNRRLIRHYGGIKKLVRLLKSKNEEVARCGAAALASCSKSHKNKTAIEAAGGIPLLAKLLNSKNENLLVPVVGILQECAADESYRVAIRTTGMIRFLVDNLSKSKNMELRTHCASAIFKCAVDADTRTLVQKYNGIEPLAALLEHASNKDLMVAVTGAIWKTAQNSETIQQYIKLGTVKKICGLMDSQPEEVLVNMVGALGACAQIPEGRSAIRESNGITPLVNLLTRTDANLLVNVTKAVGACSLDNDCMATIDRLDGVRLLWSLLKSTNPAVQASAAWAISPCIEHAKDAGEMVRSFVGGLELIVSLLKSDNAEVLASVCAALAKIAADEENLAVITDHGVVPMLAKLSNTKNDRLKKSLAEAVARCCHWGSNRVAFGAAKAVAPMVKFLKSPDAEVHRATAIALHQLSMDADNCIMMHENGVVQLLLGMVGSSDETLQEAAAGTIGNIRKLALASEKAALA